ncbi:MAG: aldehyde dehydrogenase family protein [Thermoleophilaceae bacterium]|nr:aldehyde dehydrogenase family protein [Thermoleophilaceae bacterium]
MSEEATAVIESIADGMISVQNPATGQTIGSIQQMSDAQVGDLFSRAREVQPQWEALGFEGRAKLMFSLRHWLVSNRDRVIDAVVAENGKTREDALLAELFYVADSIGFWAKKASKYLAEEKVSTHSPFVLGKKVVVRHRPVGVVGVIAPWNYPLALGIGDSLPALMAGNCVVLKPSEWTPLATEMFIEGAREVGFPEGVFTLATGDGATGAAVVEHADMIMFCGSTRTGRKVAARCGELLKTCSLELGGKDPMIVLADADLERAANVAVEWAMRNSGQICMSVERVYVEAPVYDEFVSNVTQKVAALRQGVPLTAGSVDVGAITFPHQLDVIEGHVNDALERGARVTTGGHRLEGPGQFFEPTVIVDVDHSMTCMREETFGPTLPIMKVKDEAEAVRLANDSVYGLGSSIFTKDIERGERVARQMEAGMTWINDALMSYLAQEAPMGGVGESGLGVRHGPAGIRKYCKTQTILTTRHAMKHEPAMFPNSARKNRVFSGLMAAMWGRKPKS